MTIDYQLKKEFKNQWKEKNIITVCMLSWEKFIKNPNEKNLEVMLFGEWYELKIPIPKEQILQYENFSHGICENGYQMYLEELRKMGDKNDAGYERSGQNN